MASKQPLGVVYFGADASWKDLQEIGFRRRNTCLLREFAEQPLVNKVVVVTVTTRKNAYSSFSWWRKALGFSPSSKVEDVFTLAFIPGQRWMPAIARFNLVLAKRLIRKALGSNGARSVQWCYWPSGYELARCIGLKAPIVFDADNDILTCPAVAQERPRIASVLDDCRQQAEMVVSASKNFLARCEAQGFKRPTFLRNGVDLERFSAPSREPEDLQALPRPRLGFIGTLSKWVDFTMIQHLAISNPDWSIIFIGEPYRIEIPQALKRTANVYFLGGRSAADVPAYLKHFDLGLAPYRQGPGTNSDGDSMKIFEYLAAGLPVIAMNFNGRLVEDFEGLVELAGNADDASKSIKRVLSGPKESRAAWNSRRQNFLRRNTWRHRADEAVALIQQLTS
jgi:glycosyltransferase involved in cell wall biosynthesis